jgi:hypothetical protein
MSCVRSDIYVKGSLTREKILVSRKRKTIPRGRKMDYLEGGNRSSQMKENREVRGKNAK